MTGRHRSHRLALLLETSLLLFYSFVADSICFFIDLVTITVGCFLKGDEFQPGFVDIGLVSNPDIPDAACSLSASESLSVVASIDSVTR